MGDPDETPPTEDEQEMQPEGFDESEQGTVSFEVVESF
jgi:hypothetical protein